MSRQFTDEEKINILCLYNKPNMNPYQNPVRQRYANMLALAGQMLGDTPAPTPPTTAVVYEEYRDPTPAGSFAATPRGIVLHGSRSGNASNSQLAEYRGTANWEVNNPNGLGWNVTIADYRVAEHIDVRHWGWHAKSASQFYLSVEFAQPTVNHAITDAQVDALADWIKTRVTPVWGNLGWHYPTHAEVQASGEAGDSGNTDVYPLGDPRLDALRNRLYQLLGAPGWEQPTKPPPPPPPSIKEQLLEAIAAYDRGDSLRDEIRRIADQIGA